MITLVPIARRMEDNTAFAAVPGCAEILAMNVQYYDMIGYRPPWIGYFAEEKSLFIGLGGFKGALFLSVCPLYISRCPRTHNL
nr:MAG: hypothetical protein DIU61_10325 [Bacteroidota bacterium]